MFKNYLKTTLRNLLKYKMYSGINILGLGIGLTVSLLIGLYVMDELSYDRFHENSNLLYRVTESRNVDGQELWYATTRSALPTAFKGEFPFVEQITHIHPTSGLIRSEDGKKFQEENIIYADSGFFDMFSFSLLSGDAETALKNPLSIVISEAVADKFFGDSYAVGNTLSFKGTRGTFDLEITAVVKNPPSNSHIQFDYIISYESLQTIRPWEYNVWYYTPSYTYLELSDNASLADLKAALPAFQQKYISPETGIRQLDLQPISDIRLFSNMQNELGATLDIRYIYLFSAIGIFILIIASINFMNLATARSLKRAREVGMRKTLGAKRLQLAGQFLGEAILFTSISMGIALISAELILPYFNQISGKALSLGMLPISNLLIITAITILFVGFISGSYPAFYLSSFKPIQALKDISSKEGFSTSMIRKGLVTFQFFITTGLIFGTLIITKQLDFLQNEKLGFNKERVAIVSVRETDDQFQIKTLKDRITSISGIESATAVSGVPGISSGIQDFNVIPLERTEDTLSVMTITADHSFLNTLQLNLIEGRDFSEDFSSDETEAVIINETAAKLLGWEKPVGEKLSLQFFSRGLVEKEASVIGLVQDFQYNSLHSNVEPILIHIFSETYYHDYLAIRLASDDIRSTLGQVEAAWREFNTERPFEYAFLDDTFDAMYRTEEQLSVIFNAFAIVAICIACLGLFGLASYSTEQRVKELGIRKILGASEIDILSLLSKDFLKLVLIGFLLSAPFSIYFLNEWLQNFTDRIEINIGVFFFVGVIALSVAVIAVGHQSLRAAIKNPVNNLRSE